ncbi:unnamed protein product [Symbiodinium natans]|uniref:Uncharacterized protein n=1 Tax=Symbiodinium natans TaxID=878477 RepID=A0A812SC20_9DINO|nr:unnamed protein product [Symbiodinium natans]
MAYWGPKVLYFGAALWWCFVPMYMFAYDMVKLMGQDNPTGLEVLLIKALAMYCLFLGVGCFLAARSGSFIAYTVSLWTMLGICTYFACVFYPFDVRLANSPYFGTPAYFVIWFSWILSVLLVVAALVHDYRLPTKEKFFPCISGTRDCDTLQLPKARKSPKSGCLESTFIGGRVYASSHT